MWCGERSYNCLEIIPVPLPANIRTMHAIIVESKHRVRLCPPHFDDRNAFLVLHTYMHIYAYVYWVPSFVRVVVSKWESWIKTSCSTHSYYNNIVYTIARHQLALRKTVSGHTKSKYTQATSRLIQYFASSLPNEFNGCTCALYYVYT